MSPSRISDQLPQRPKPSRRSSVDSTPISRSHGLVSTSSRPSSVSKFTDRDRLLSESKPSSVHKHTARSSPTDLLIASILDGDSQSVQSVIRSQGSDLKSDYWLTLAPSILPLHRAVSGLHFHGNDKLLVSTLTVLIQLGADIKAVDNSGASILHRVLLICTSKSVCPVLELLLVQGADPNIQNKDGEAPIHLECKRCALL
jgi:hypothetical protein